MVRGEHLMKVLFVTHPYPNYVPDLLMHGLRKLLGADAVDYPRKACLYEGVLGLGICPNSQRCPGWFPDDGPEIDRSEILSKVKNGFFDMVVCDWRAASALYNQLGDWPKKCVIIDGEDHPQTIKPGPYLVCRRETDGSDYSIPLPMALPEEIFNWIARYDEMPKRFSVGFLGSSMNDGRQLIAEELSRRYPDALLRASDVPSPDNPAPEGRLSRDLYYQKLQQCQVVLSLAGGGFDTFRFWEHAACNAVHLAPRFPLFIPNDFNETEEMLRFDGTTDDLRRRIDGVLSNQDDFRSTISQGRYKLVNHHLTTHRAAYLLDRANQAFGN